METKTFLLLISKLKVEVLGCCSSDTEITAILTDTDNWGGSWWEESGKITAGNLRFCRSSLKSLLFETKLKWKIEIVFQTLISKNFRDKEIQYYPSQQGWVLLLVWNFQWNSCFIVHLSAWRLSALIMRNPRDSLGDDHVLILIPITCPCQSSNDRELPLELPKSNGFHCILHHESIWKENNSSGFIPEKS